MKEKYALTEAQLKQIIYETIEASLNEGKFGRALGTAALGAAMALGGCKGNTEPNTVPPTHMVQQTPSQIEPKEYSAKYRNFNSPVKIINKNWRKPDEVSIGNLYNYVDTLFQNLPYNHTVKINIKDYEIGSREDSEVYKWYNDNYGRNCEIVITTTLQYSQKTKMSSKKMFGYLLKALKNDSTYQYVEMEGGYQIQYHFPNEYFPIYNIFIKDNAFKIEAYGHNYYVPGNNVFPIDSEWNPLYAEELTCYPSTMEYFIKALTGEAFKTKGKEWDFE